MTSYFTRTQTLNVKGRILHADGLVMGILNATPDSFYSGSRAQTVETAIAAAGKMLEDGAAILDIGAYSTRPGAEEISTAEELDRLIPVIEGVVGAFPGAILSADTFRATVARAAVEAGAAIVNDVSGGGLDREMFSTVAALQVPYVLMHMRGTPQTMTKMTGYADIALEILEYFNARIVQLRALGVKDIILDPGFGFAKTAAESFELLNRMEELQIAGLPLLAGFSRKSMIYKTLNITPEEALNGTTVLNTIALTKGAGILRVHDVKEAVESVSLFNRLGSRCSHG